jgi:hypothetical protein
VGQIGLSDNSMKIVSKLGGFLLIPDLI